jgi:hypothetical protein
MDDDDDDDDDYTRTSLQRIVMDDVSLSFSPFFSDIIESI